MQTKYVKYDEFLKKKENVGRFDFKNMPVFPKSEENLVKQIVKHLRDVIRIYGHISLIDVYDIIEIYEPSLHADKYYIDNMYGWKRINDLYMLHTEHGATIGIQTDPMILG